MYHIPVKFIPSIYIGHIAGVSDVIDGAFGDEDYEVQAYINYEIKWETVS